MKRLYYSDASGTPPSPPKNPITNQYPQDGNRAKKQMPTVIGAYWYHMMTEEFMNVIEGAGLTPDEKNLHQLADIFDDFRTRAAKAEEYATQAKTSADNAAASATGVVTETEEKIKEIQDEGAKQVAAVQSAGSTVSSDVDTAKASLQSKADELTASLESEGGTQVAYVQSQASDIVNQIKTSEANAKDSADSASSNASTVAASLTTIQSLADQVQNNADAVASNTTAAASSASAAKSSEAAASKASDSAASAASAASASETAAASSAEEAKNAAATATKGQVNSDWAETDSESKAYIVNKPNLSVYLTTAAFEEWKASTIDLGTI